MFQVAIATFGLSILGIAALIVRRLPTIAAIPIGLTDERRGKFSLVTSAGARLLRFWWDVLVFGKRIGFWVINFSLEKALRKVRIIALRTENFSARKLEDMRVHSHDIPRFSFFEDFINRSDKDK